MTDAISIKPDAQALLDGYALAWRSNQAEDIANHWEPSRFLFYKAEEMESFFTEWEQVLDYWRHNESLHDGISLQFSRPDSHRLSDELYLTVAPMRWDIRFAADARLPDGSAFPHRGQAMGGDNHVLVFFCRSSDGWKICGWNETPNAAITYMRSLYFQNANTDLV